MEAGMRGVRQVVRERNGATTGAGAGSGRMSGMVGAGSPSGAAAPHCQATATPAGVHWDAVRAAAPLHRR